MEYTGGQTSQNITGGEKEEVKESRQHKKNKPGKRTGGKCHTRQDAVQRECQGKEESFSCAQDLEIFLIGVFGRKIYGKDNIDLLDL